MIKVSFEYEIGTEIFSVRAKCSNIDAYGADGLILSVTGSEEGIDPNLDRETMEEIKEEAIEHLYNKKYHEDLDF